MLALEAWDLVAIPGTWLFYYVFIHVLYYGLGSVMSFAGKKVKPDAGTHKLSEKMKADQLKLSEIAFPLYCVVPTLAEFARRKNLSVVCDTFEECGGFAKSTFNFFIYLVCVEAVVFWIHYWLLHVWPTGKAQLKHHVHHVYKHKEDMAVWTGYAFEAADGAVQGLPFVLFQFFIPIPMFYMVFAGAFTGVWTMYIHMGDFGLPWPFMGADYHHLHHVYNWYNFGLYTRFFDWIFGTLRSPHSTAAHSKDAELARGKAF